MDRALERQLEGLNIEDLDEVKTWITNKLQQTTTVGRCGKCGNLTKIKLVSGIGGKDAVYLCAKCENSLKD